MGASMGRARSTIQVGVAIAFVALLASTKTASAQALRGDALANSLKGNVVRIAVKWPNDLKTGFGFVVGEREGFIYIVTANHVVRGDNPTEVDNTPTLYFFQDQGKEYKGELLATSLSRAQGDVAVIRVPPPIGFSWRRDVRAVVAPARGMDAWFVGLQGEWRVPARPGAISEGAALNNTIRFEVPVRAGSSGAPLLLESGIAGMILTEGDVFGEATPLDTIQRAFGEWMYPWQLEPPNPGRAQATLTSPAPPPPPPPPPSQPSWPTGYKTRANRDIWGQDIPLSTGKIGIRDIEIDGCARLCSNRTDCLGFSYDQWMRTCYLKNRINQSILDARSTVAVKRPNELPNVSQDIEAKLDTLKNVRILGQIGSSNRTSGFDSCRTACNANLACVAFNYIKATQSGDNCEMYKSSDGRTSDSSTDSGFKYQAP